MKSCRLIITLVCLLVVSGMVGCTREAPTVTSNTATGVGTNSATLNIAYDFNDYGSGQVQFKYKKSTDTNWTFTSWLAKSGSGTYAEAIGSLTPNTKYNFAARLKYDTTEIEGSGLSFTTSNIRITVTSPNGGENWAVGSTQAITWTSEGVTGNVNIRLSRNGGTSWTTIISNTTNDGNQNWVVTGPATTQARIRVVSVATPDVFGESDANFSIVQRITVTSPNGGENWAVGSTQTIIWTSKGVTGNVNIQLSRNGGTSWTTIISNTTNDGNQNWVVTGPVTTQARIRVVSVAAPDVFDASDANFTVQRITVTSPNGGENWAVGSTQALSLIHI